MMDLPKEGEEPAGRNQTGRAALSVSSHVSMKNEETVTDGHQRLSKGQLMICEGPLTHRPVSPVPSCVSMKSDWSMGDPPDFSSGPPQSEPKPQTHRPVSPVPSCVSMKTDWSMGDPPDFSSGPPQSEPNVLRASDLQPPPDEHTDMAESSSPLQTEQTPESGGTQDYEDLRRVMENHKASLKRRFEHISEGIIKPGAETLLNKIYTDVYVTEGESEGVNREHEVWQVESASRAQTTEDTPINCDDIFKPLPGQERHIRSVMTKGVAGIGKTVSVQKFILNWTEGEANQDVDFMIPLSFRELNLVRGVQYSLHGLLLDFHPELKELKNSEEYKDCQVVFIFDGLDESRLSLDLEQNMKLSDVKQISSIDVLMTSLIQGTLLPSARIWITSRPAAASQIPAQYINRVTEVRGFSDPQKEEYFKKKITCESQANKIILHIKASRSLHIMCHIPVFCWIAATVLQQMLEQDNTQEIPKTLTEMFIHFLLIQTTRKDQKYQKKHQTDMKRLLESQKGIILKLAELAFKNLENGNLMFYEEDLRECGIDVREASVYSGMCTEIFKEESLLQQRKVYCFVHLSIQEFLAAVFVFHSYVTENLEALKSFIREEHRDDLHPFLSSLQLMLGLKSKDNLHVLLKSAVDEALKSKNGHLDLFLRFLMGICLERNYRLLQCLLNHTHSTSKSIKETCQYIKRLNREDISPERYINLSYCLFEMDDHSMHKEIQIYLKSKNHKQTLSPAHCSALAHMFLMSEEVLDEFDLNEYNTSNEGRRRLLPAVRCCRKARLKACQLTHESCKIVALILQSVNSLKELDLSDNDLGDSGVQLIAEGLSSPRCELQTLRLAHNRISDEGYVCLALTLMLNPSCVKELDLSNNHSGESAEKLLFATLKGPHRQVKDIQLAACKLSDKSCEILAHVLQSANSLVKLDLNNIDLRDSGVQLLSTGLSSPHCKLQTLRLAGCRLTHRSCENVALVLQSPNSLLHLDLTDNGLGDPGLQLLSKGLSSSHCKLQTLRLAKCTLKDTSCEIVTSVLQSPNFLLHLDLSDNDLGDNGVQLLSRGLSSPHCKLQTLRLSGCLISENGYTCLASALMSNPSHLKELDLSYNYPGESGLKLLSARLEDPVYKLETLKTDHASRIGRLLRYVCELTLDPNTAYTLLSLSEGNRKATRVRKEQLYPDHPERFDWWSQVLCREGLSGRCYWEVEWSGRLTDIAVAYKSIQRKGGRNDDSRFGRNGKSWRLDCSRDSYSAWHNNKKTVIPAPSSRSSRVGVYLDWPAGTLSFYSVSSDTHTHLHTFHSTFTEPLYPGFWVWPESSVSLCQIT